MGLGTYNRPTKLNSYLKVIHAKTNRIKTIPYSLLLALLNQRYDSNYDALGRFKNQQGYNQHSEYSTDIIISFWAYAIKYVPIT